ncbi:acyl carrier protein [Tissierella creatinophila]|uniref:Acyl carrier protein n=1 Tax=Tissierella creatinophila DSM 6911 TaxID=1123403 RepID=A0A1U7M360_TISCR|nr:acyl carrier protein [Tissierella creatinophila]OLS01731.1 acyl carrier protein [Tissierella creatinophila DSM 6911]
MENKIKEIISEQFNLDVEKVNLDTNFQDDLNADSLDLVELIMAFEDQFNLEINDEDVSNIKTVSDALEEISKKLDDES